MTQVNYIGIIARAISLASKMKGKNKEFLMLPRAWLEMGLLLMATKSQSLFAGRDTQT